VYRWPWTWTAIAIIAAAVASVFDAALLQRSRSYFTGGFLSADHVQTLPQAVAFIAGSLLSDLGVVGIMAVLGQRFASWLGLRDRLAVAVASVVAGLPILVSDAASYRLHTYLGDAFDLRLMFDLAGRDVGEIWAVASDHLIAVAGGALVAILAITLVVLVVRHRKRGAGPRAAPQLALAMELSLALFVIATVSNVALRIESEVLDNGLRRKPSGQWLGAVANLLSDVDRDGYGVLGRPPDPNLLDSRVRPYAPDLPGNGVDEDGVAGDLPAHVPPYAESTAPVPVWNTRPDVVLIVLESFRADALGAVHDGTPVTPVLDALASNGVSVRRAYSHNGYTVQARHHIFTGSIANLRGPTTIIDDFAANGYQTAYFSGQDESYGGDANSTAFAHANVAYDARADRDRRYSTFTTAGSLAVPYTVLLDRVTEFLKTRRGDRPLFLYVNFHDTHFPYLHEGVVPILRMPRLNRGDIVPERAADLRGMYLNTAANVDRAVGKVLVAARDALGHEPGVVVMSDHGESLFDEGFLGHGYALNDAQTRIPLIVSRLPLHVVEPFGQSDLRDLLRNGLSSPDAGAGPTIAPDPARQVFRYLGRLDRPGAVGFTGLRSQLVYDFRDRKVRRDDGSWRGTDELSEAERTQWLDLVTTWERMVVAANASH
jgi:glucan phosphoethanolaminetransferase (alkaline phosphatase superfamily)